MVGIGMGKKAVDHKLAKVLLRGKPCDSLTDCLRKIVCLLAVIGWANSMFAGRLV
jgi:hypothetical protein